MDFYRSITEFWKDALRPGGALIFEVGFDGAEHRWNSSWHSRATTI